MNIRKAGEDIIWKGNDAGLSGLLGNCLRPLGAVYGAAARIREKMYGAGIIRARAASAPVISVGNITLGGSGKTPLVMEIARRCRDLGMKPVILTRGYGGKDRSLARVVSPDDNSEAVGDEALMMARSLRDVPVVRGADRARAALFAAKLFDPDLFILDDGFGHLRLRRDFDIVVVDADRGFGNSRVFPAGPLREPLSALNRADVIVVRCDDDDALTPYPSPRGRGVRGEGRAAPLQKYAPDATVIKMCPVIEGLTAEPGGRVLSVDIIENKSVFAFSGIANPASFDRTMRRAGFLPVEHLCYPDHHNYGPSDIADIARAAKMDVGAVLTTEKDLARFSSKGFIGKIPLFAIRIRMEVEQFEWLIKQIQSKLNKNPGT